MSNYVATLQNIAYDAVKTTAAVMAVNMTVGQPIKNQFGTTNPIAEYAADGVCYALAGDLVNIVTGAPSDLLNMRYTRFLDNCLFMGEVAVGADKTGATNLALNTMRNFNLPLSESMQYDIAQGIIISSARELANIISNPNTTLGSNQYITYLRYPLSSTLGKAINA